MKRALKCWEFLKQVLGEGDYERYCSHLKRKHPEQSALSAPEFYRMRMQEKYSRPTRCC